MYINDKQSGMIKPLSNNLIEVVGLPQTNSGFTMYLDNGMEVGNYENFTTVYLVKDETTIQYSNDGSVYVEPEPIPIPEPYVPTEEELAEIERQNKIVEISNQIESLKFQISSTDYIIIKASEWSFVGKECEEYDMVAIHAERQLIRDKINALEKELEVLYNERDII